LMTDVQKHRYIYITESTKNGKLQSVQQILNHRQETIIMSHQ